MLKKAAALCAAYYLAVYAVLAFLRLGYPYTIDWIEGVMAHAVQRILAGQPVYTVPSIDYVPHIYGPLYYWASAPLAYVFGPGFTPMRALSIAASFGLFAVIYSIVRRETGSRFAAFLAAGLMAASYKMAGASYDLARVDTLFIFMLAAGFAVFLRAERARGFAGAGVLFGLALLTKQSGVFFYAALCLYLLIYERRRLPVFAAAGAGLFGAVSLLYDKWSDGWFSYYCFIMPRLVARVPSPESMRQFWTDDIFGFHTVAVVFAFIFLWSGRTAPAPKKRALYGLAFAGALAGSYFGRILSGSGGNALTQIYFMLAVLFGLGLDRALKAASAAENRAALRQAAVYGAAVILFLSLLYDPRVRLPKERDRHMGRTLVATLADVKGEVYAPHYATVPRLAGKRTYANRSSYDTIFAQDKAMARLLSDSIERALADGRFAAVLCGDDFFPDTVRRYYEQAAMLPIIVSKFWYPNDKPMILFIRKQDA